MSKYYGTYDVAYECANCGKRFETFYCNGVDALPVIDCRECKCKGTARKVAGSNTAFTRLGAGVAREDNQPVAPSG